MAEAWILDAVRTPRGKGKPGSGGLSGIHPQELLAQCLNALRARQGFEAADVEDVVAGCVSDVHDQAGCIARNAVLAAGWDPQSGSGVTLNRCCSSGQQAVNFAAIPLEVMRDLDLDPEKVNGGAIALGHPLGATGAMRIGTALDELERRDHGAALVTMCIGGGMGIASVLERI